MCPGLMGSLRVFIAYTGCEANWFGGWLGEMSGSFVVLHL